MTYLRALPLCPPLDGSDLAGITPLYVACYNHRLEMIDYLLGDPSLEISGQHGPNQSNVFHGVVDRDFRGIAETLITYVKKTYEHPGD